MKTLALKRYHHITLLALIGALVISCKEEAAKPKENKAMMADENNAGLTLPEGFGAYVVADNLGEARHIAVTNSGAVFVKLNGLNKAGQGILVLKDTDEDGRTDSISGFGDFGGTGLALKNHYLYASSNSDVFRYNLDAGQMPIAGQAPDTIVKGLIDRRQHNSKSITLDNDGNLYVNIGAYSNACQAKDRNPGSPGMMPCPILDSAGGIWKFKANKLIQTYMDGQHYATGLRNVVGLDWNQQANQLFVMQHGRDQLHNLYPDLYDDKQSAILPAETMYALKEGDNAGWPYVYYDQIQKKKILAPEYGGDGQKTGGEDAIDPAVAFPGHWAPNALLFYTGDQFPEKYKNGAFIAFHGSWNRAPEPQAGYSVVFVPFKDGKPSGDYEVFADGFAGKDSFLSPGDAQHRPTGLAQGPDGSLYISDDAHGTIFRIVYTKK